MSFLLPNLLGQHYAFSGNLPSPFWASTGLRHTLCSPGANPQLSVLRVVSYQVCLPPPESTRYLVAYVSADTARRHLLTDRLSAWIPLLPKHLLCARHWPRGSDTKWHRHGLCFHVCMFCRESQTISTANWYLYKKTRDVMRKYPGEKFFWLGCQKSFCCAKSCLTLFEELIIGWTLSGYKKSACRVSKHSRKLNWTQRVSLQNIQEHSRNPERRGLLGHWRSLVFPADTMGKHLKGWRGGCHKNKTFFWYLFSFFKKRPSDSKTPGWKFDDE